MEGRTRPSLSEAAMRWRLVPVIHDELVADLFFEGRGQDAIVCSFSRPVKGLIRQTAEPGGKAKSKPREQPKNEVGIYVDTLPRCLHKPGYVAHISSRKCLHNLIARRVGIVFFNLRRILIEQSIQDVGGGLASYS